ncbi:MAG: protein kinase [Calditrichia bacterium]
MLIGKTILHYRILEKLGEGGMGVVYRAEDTKLKRFVAIKFLPRHVAYNPADRNRFEIEAQAAAALNHPNIATIYAIEENENSEGEKEIFIAMEYIEGRELKDVIASQNGTPLPLKDVVQYATQIAEGIQAAHEKGIVHRDIKSSNIMITNKGQLKVMDFGLAKMRGGAEITRIGTTLGTVAYMSPEQAKGEETDEQSDIWSFGVVLYELLSGELPFGGGYEQAVMYSVIHENFTPLSAVREDISPQLEAIVGKCLEKDRSQRYQTFAEILEDIQKLNGGIPLDSEISLSKRSTGRKRISEYFPRAALILAGLVLLAVMVTFAVPSGWKKIRAILPFESAPAVQHLVVLPFTNVSGDSSGQIFCDGLMETLTSKLTQMEQFHGSLWVVPASEVIRNRIDSPGQANKTFGVNLTITGSLQRINNMYRLTLNLVDAKNVRQLNSAVIDVKATDMASLQDETVSQLLDMMNLELNPDARKILRAGNTKVPAAYESYLKALGYLQRYENTKNIQAAINLFEAATVLDSTYALAYAGLGKAFWLMYEASKNSNYVEKAKSSAEKAYSLNEKLPSVNITLGMIHSGTGLYSDALRDFTSALNVDPTNAEAYRGLARAYETQDKLKDAESTYKKAITLKPDYWAGYNELGAYYYRHGRYREAAEQFRHVVELTPDNYRGYNNLGAIYYLLEQWDKAGKMFERSFSIQKSYSVASNLGTLYYIEGKYAEAARMYKTALTFNDHDQLVWGNLAAAYYWAPGEREKAVPAFREAIKRAEKELQVNPKNGEIISQLAGYYAMVGEDAKALKFVQQSLSIAPNDAQIMYRAGTTYEQLGDREKAIHWIHEAIKNGYSKSEIEHQPELRELLNDPRFREAEQRDKAQAVK